jgi:Tfp pilus assembly protein PilF
MDTPQIPTPHLEGEAAKVARKLLDKVLAWRESRDDAKLERELTDAEAKLRRGPNLRPGELLDRRYLLLEARSPSPIAGRWRAWDLDQSVEVGVRVLHPQHLTDPVLYDRFQTGPAAQQRVAGPDVAPVVSFDQEWSGFAYCVVAEPGLPLASRIGAIPADDRLPLLLEITEAVERLHRAGTTHGALAPESVLLGPDGAVTLTDLGMYGGSVGVYTAPEAATPSTVATVATDAYLVGLLALTVLRDAPLPYWVTRDPTDILAEIADVELRGILAQMLHWKAEQRPELGALLTSLRGDVERQASLARAASRAGRHGMAVSRFRGVVAARPTDRALRREFATILTEAGNPAEAASVWSEALLLSGPEHGDLSDDFAALRGLCDRTGDHGPYEATLQALAADGIPSRDIALFELARFHRDRTADWERALEAHKTRAQAVEALRRLYELTGASGESRRQVRWGRDLHASLPAEDQDGAAGAALAHELGHLFLGELSDPDNGLLWLDKALLAGHTDPELPTVVRQLRTDRGEWAQTLELLVTEADHAGDRGAGGADGDGAAGGQELLKTAADVARWALGDAERAAALDARVLALGPDDDALRLSARRALAEGRREAAARALSSLAAPRPEDACRCVDAWTGSQRPDEALTRLRQAREAWPQHVGLMQRALVLGMQSGDDALAFGAAEEIVDRLGPSATGRREAQHLLADRARRQGQLLAAARTYQELIADDEQDSAAWWGLVQIAWTAARTEAEPAWLRAAPRRFPPQEALARLVGGLLEPAGVLKVLIELEGVSDTGETTRLERAGALVDRLVLHGTVDSLLFDELAALAGDEEAAWVEAVRRLWYGSSRADVAFPVAAAHSWCPWDGPDYFGKSVRTPLGSVPATPTRSPGILADAEVRAALFVRSADVRHLSAEGQPPHVIEAVRRPAVVSEGAAIPLVGTLYVGTRPDAHLVLGAGPAERCRFEQRGDRVYVVADPAVEVSGWPVTETRLQDGTVVVVDGHPLRFVADLPPDAPVPSAPAPEREEEDTLPGMAIVGDEPHFREEPTDVTGEADAIRAALFYRQDGAERIFPLTGVRVVIGPDSDSDLKVGTGSGWFARIEHPGLGIYQIEVQGTSGPGGSGQPKLLTQGERFTAGDVEFEFQVVEARTPAPPPPRDPPEFQRGDRVPTLFWEDGDTKKTLTIARDTFTIGRGRRNDLQLANDGKLSRHHCTFVVGPLGVRVRDNNSSNGTMVNGELVDERLLGDGDRIQIGDTSLEFRWALTRPIAPMLVDDTRAENDDGMGTMIETSATRLMRRGTSVTVSDGRTKLQAANEALSLIAAALDRAGGVGHGRAVVQLVVDATPKRFAPLFAGVEARSTGVPEMVVLYNLAQRPESAQRSLLNEALLDLVERTVSQVVDNVPPEEADRLLEDLAETRYREHLRL